MREHHAFCRPKALYRPLGFMAMVLFVASCGNTSSAWVLDVKWEPHDTPQEYAGTLTVSTNLHTVLWREEPGVQSDPLMMPIVSRPPNAGPVIFLSPNSTTTQILVPYAGDYAVIVEGMDAGGEMRASESFTFSVRSQQLSGISLSAPRTASATLFWEPPGVSEPRRLANFPTSRYHALLRDPEEYIVVIDPGVR